MVTRILSADYLIADMVVELDGHQRLSKLIKKYGMLPGSKGRIDHEGFMAFSRAVENYPISISPGGSAANTLYALGKILKKKVQISFLGAKGSSLYGKMIEGSLREAGIKLIPDRFDSDIRPETTVSFVIKFPGGDRAIGTYPGNVAKLITKDVITDAMVKNTDILFIPGSLYRKFDVAVPDKLFKLARKHKKQVWVSLPTQGRFTEEHLDMVRSRIESHANMIFGNEEELKRLFGPNAVDALQKSMKKHQNMEVAFITRGGSGVMIITKDKVSKLPTIKVPKIVNTLGAGDVSYAGFMAGQLCNLSYEDSAKIGLVLAKHKLGLDFARIPDPAGVIKKNLPDLSDRIF